MFDRVLFLSFLCWKLYFGKAFFAFKYLPIALVPKFQRLYVKHIYQTSISWKVQKLTGFNQLYRATN